jgi:DNA-binding FrmR family transcriptional regulator
MSTPCLRRDRQHVHAANAVGATFASRSNMRKSPRERLGDGYEQDKPDLLRRLRKIEGQIRGIQQMIESDRHCLEITQQLTAAVSGAREVTAILLGDHLQRCLNDPEHCGDGAVNEVVVVLRKMMKA